MGKKVIISSADFSADGFVPRTYHKSPMIQGLIFVNSGANQGKVDINTSSNYSKRIRTYGEVIKIADGQSIIVPPQANLGGCNFVRYSSVLSIYPFMLPSNSYVSVGTYAANTGWGDNTFPREYTNTSGADEYIVITCRGTDTNAAISPNDVPYLEYYIE